MSRWGHADDTDVAHRLIRELVDSLRAASDYEVDRLINYIARAPFNTQTVAVPIELQGREYLGQTLSSTADSLTVHLVSRVLSDRQWRAGTTATSFQSDIQAAVLHPSARLIVYQRRGGYLAAILSGNPVPAARRGDRTLPLLFIVYALQRDSIISAYQASDVDQLSIPGDALWLR